MHIVNSLNCLSDGCFDENETVLAREHKKDRICKVSAGLA